MKNACVGRALQQEEQHVQRPWGGDVLGGEKEPCEREEGVWKAHLES